MLRHIFFGANFTKALMGVLWISLFVGLYSLFIYFVFERYVPHSTNWLSYFQSVFGIILGLLLVFRSNRAYERWWEARTLWGQLVNATRNFAIKVDVLLNPTVKERQEFADNINQFCSALAIHLRQKNAPEQFKKLLNQQHLPQHVPSYLAKNIYDLLLKSPKSSE